MKYHAPVKYGGMGLPLQQCWVPIISRHRHWRWRMLCEINPVLQALVNTSEYILKVEGATGAPIVFRGTMTNDKQSLPIAIMMYLHNIADGHGLTPFMVYLYLPQWVQAH